MTRKDEEQITNLVSEARTWVGHMQAASIASCSCMTKTGELSYHNVKCRYRALQEGISIINEFIEIDETRIP